jgi:prepilin-type processing-associated H-X9-DG protein
LAGAAETGLTYPTATGGMGGAPCPKPAGFGPPGESEFCAANSVWSHHPGGGNFAFGDGSVRFLTFAAADPLPGGPGSVLSALVTRAGAEVVADPW